jgi:hypothetical protein
MAFPPNTTRQQSPAVVRSHLNWLLALLTTALLCVGGLTVAVGIYLIVD